MNTNVSEGGCIIIGPKTRIRALEFLILEILNGGHNIERCASDLRLDGLCVEGCQPGRH